MLNDIGQCTIEDTTFSLAQRYDRDGWLESPTTALLMHPPYRHDVDPVATLTDLHTDQPQLALAEDAPADLRDLLLRNEAFAATVVARAAELWRTCHDPDCYRDDRPEPSWWRRAVDSLAHRDDRQRILEDLITLRVPTREAVPRAKRLRVPGFGRPLTTLTRSHVRHVLDLHRSGDMAWEKVTAWAETVLHHLGAPGPSAYLAVEPGARASLTSALLLMTGDEPREDTDFRAIYALTRDDYVHWSNAPSAAAAALLAFTGLAAWTYPWELAEVIPAHLQTAAALTAALPIASIFWSWALAGHHAAVRQLEFWAVLTVTAVIAITVFDFGLLN